MKNANGVFKEQQEEKMVNHPKHYNQYDMETIVMMEKIWGKDAVFLWCEMTAFKYRMRMGLKEGNPIEQDLAKEKWYLDRAKQIIMDAGIIPIDGGTIGVRNGRFEALRNRDQDGQEL